MKRDIILAGVGGQGVLSLAAIIARAAVAQGLNVRQSEVHGMAQRGGAVLAHLRLADGPIASDLVPRGGADLILSLEPVESLRYVSYLAPDGALVTACEAFVNIPDYPDLARIHAAIRALPAHRLVEAEKLAKEAGLAKAVNMVMVGATFPFLNLSVDTMRETICELFSAKDSGVVTANQKAFDLGLAAGEARA